MATKPKTFDPHRYINTDPAWFREFEEQELKRISNGERMTPDVKHLNAHGMAVFMETEEFYDISYSDEIPSIRMPKPEPLDLAPTGYHNFEITDLKWEVQRWALIDPYEALLLNSRWGSAARHILPPPGGA